VTVASANFQRARSPAQQEQRRAAILAAARGMLDQMPAAEVSLRELSRQVGLSKSNVVRYFPTREAVFLAVLASELDAWLANVESQLSALDPSSEPREPTAQIEPREPNAQIEPREPTAQIEPREPTAHIDLREPNAQIEPNARHAQVAATLARTLGGHPRLCELLAVCPTVLEHNVPPETARGFKVTALAQLTRLAVLVRTRIPELGEAGAAEFAGLAWALTAGAWPMANPGPVVASVLADPQFTAIRVDFVPAMTRSLTVVLDGITCPS
jgi:AcrR family transcriptional regulator